MKTQVMQLDPHDDIVSVRDKMKWTKAPRLLLVFPPKGALLARTLDLLLLHRHASTLGVRLGLVTTLPGVRRAAQELGLPVFASADAAQRTDWPDESRRPRSRRRERPDLRALRRNAFPPEARWRGNPVFRLLFFILAVLAILALVVVLLPSATVTLSPALETQTVNLSLSASADVVSVSAAGEVPARSATLAVDGSRTVTVTGTATVPDQPAEGVVRFTNLTMAVVGIPAGTVVRTQADPPVRFATLTDGVLAATAGKMLDIPVRALDPGTAGNLPAGALVVIEGGLGASLSASNPDPTAGGTDKTSAVPSADDRARLRAALIADLRRQAIASLADTLEPGSIIFPDTVLPAAGLTETYDPAPGQPGSQLTLTISGTFAAEYAAGSDLRALAAAVLDAHLPAGYESLPDTLTVSEVGQPVTGADGVTRWTVTLTRSMRPRLDPVAAAQLVQGKSPKAAARLLEGQYRLSAAPEFGISPSFWPWLPMTTLRIAITIK
ncbi:MAG: hypothetical protein FD146_1899 [Anaerolineaceae bacterium]|nr:MAG: hypothetical protein FD146_1899 [Anaerolineaceae bacterium]